MLEKTFNDVDLVGRLLTIGNFVNSSAFGAIFSATTNTYSPFLLVGEVGRDPSQDDVIRGAALQGISGGGGLVFTTDGNSLIVYQILASPGVPVTARVRVPNGTGVAVVPGSFSVAPFEVIPGPDFDTLVFDLTLTADSPARTITWQSAVSGLRAGEARAVTLASTVDFTSQGTAGRASLPPQSVAAEQILARDPSSRTARPGEPASYTLTVKNPTPTALTYNLSVQGVPASWVGLVSSVMVGAMGTVSVPVTLASGAFDPLGESGFVIEAAGAAGSVQGSLVLAGAPLVPAADPEATGSC